MVYSLQGFFKNCFKKKTVMQHPSWLKQAVELWEPLFPSQNKFFSGP